MMLGGIFSWLIIGLIIYFMFSRKGGMMGCCGGHDHNSSGHKNHADHNSQYSQDLYEDTIDLSKEDYHISTKP